MSQEEIEFESLIKKYEASYSHFDQVLNLNARKPVFATETGIVTMAAVKEFKLLSAEYEKYYERLSQAREQLKSCSAAIDDWFPEGVKPTINRGTIMVSPTASGAIALIKKDGSFCIKRADSEAAALRNLQQTLSSYR